MKTYCEPIIEIYKFQKDDIVRTSVFENSFGTTDYDDIFEDEWR